MAGHALAMSILGVESCALKCPTAGHALAMASLGVESCALKCPTRHHRWTAWVGSLW